MVKEWRLQMKMSSIRRAQIEVQIHDLLSPSVQIQMRWCYSSVSYSKGGKLLKLSVAFIEFIRT